MALPELKRRLPKALMLFSLCCLCFAHGWLAAHFKVFPHGVIRDAETAYYALVEASQAAPLTPTAYGNPDEAPIITPTARQHSSAAGDEFMLVSGGPGYLTDRHAAGCLAWLVDRQGTVQHFWKYDPSVWSDLKHVSRVPMVSGKPYPVGLHLFDDGSLLAVFQAQNTFPFAIGIARFDVDSNLLWKKEIFAHHWPCVAEDGRIFVPALRVVDSPVAIGRTREHIYSENGKIYNDLIVVLDADGAVLDEISMLDALVESGRVGLVARPGNNRPDPLHLNSVQVAGAQAAKLQPWLAPDDLLVSFLSTNTVGILDPNSRRFKWLSTGTTLAQHSPRFYDDGVIVLDNMGGDKDRGGTQLVKIDLERGQPTVLFPKPDVATPGRCFTDSSGHLDLSRDGNRVLMALANAGVVWEVDLKRGEVLWEYSYVHSTQYTPIATIHTAKYVENPSFLHHPDKS
jgi:hypothetical protein